MREQNSKVWWKQTVLNTQLPPDIASTKSIRSSRSPTGLSDRVTVHLDKVSASCLFEGSRWDFHRVLEHAT
jgi:hypothetical protein